MSWDETAVLMAVRGYTKYFDIIKGGIICHDNDSNDWDKNGNRDFYLLQKMPVSEMEAVLNKLIKHQHRLQTLLAKGYDFTAGSCFLSGVLYR
jgi:hypothetical protein